MERGGSWSLEGNPHSSEIEKWSEESVSFKINGFRFKASKFPIKTKLITFIRDYANLKGTKYMCEEGGCGACIVAATIPNPQTGKPTTVAVNSCLTPIYNCHGWAIETIEALGKSSTGYGKIQARLALSNGSQCGYCSPGMVMSMYSLLQEKKEISMSEIENSFGGNICRCTGYRPILDAFKSFAKDASEDLVRKCVDIEELTIICPRTKEECLTSCGDVCDRTISLNKSKIKLTADDGKIWYRVSSVIEIFEILNMIVGELYMLVGGNTGFGVYRDIVENIKHFIDIKGVEELTTATITNNFLIIGANLTLTNAIIFLKSVSKSNGELFGYGEQMAEHIDLVANPPVRNIGTIAGNLSIKHQHREFPSDIFLLLETVRAQLKIVDFMGVVKNITLQEFLYTDMRQKVIKHIILPSLDRSSYKFKSYKIMPRAQSSHAIVNAGFLFKFDDNNKSIVTEKPRIIFGGISPYFVHAEMTEKFLEGKSLLDSRVLEETLRILANELRPDYVLPDASPQYRRGLAISLFYKFVLSLFPDKVSSKVRSGGTNLIRPLSSGSQTFQTDKSLWPVNEPVIKLEALAQCSGEAQFVNDIPNLPGELHAAVVVAKKATAASFELKPDKALKMDGVVAIFTAKDIPGKNDFMPAFLLPVYTGEEILASGKISFAGQAVAVVVAKKREIALKAANEVEIEYKNLVHPQIDFTEIIESQDESRITFIGNVGGNNRKDDVKHKVSGKFKIGWQYHFTMETQTCLCVPLEDGMDVYPTTQWPTMIQYTIANALNVQQNRINVKVRRIGGSYGAKISRNTQISALCALCAHILQRPVRFSLNIETNMQMMGKRLPSFINYEAGVDESGKIQYLDAKMYEDVGARPNDAALIVGYYTLNFLRYPYNTDTWNINVYSVTTDTPPNTWMRAPGATEASASIENIIEHIARVVKRDPLFVRLQNFGSESEPLIQMIDEIKVSSNYEKAIAEVEAFNSINRWKKQGISFAPLCYLIDYLGFFKFHCNISIFAGDGTVAISHGGTESGQGINTKAAQVCAHLLGIPLELVTVKPTLSLISPNDFTTGSSITSESVSYAVKKCCEEINERLQPFKNEMPSANWKTIVQAANNANVDLNCSFMFKKDEKISNYLIYGVTCMRVEVDILTGQHVIMRADIIEDAGQSLSPNIDIGQIEGAFIMGMGYFLCEEIVYDKETGQILTDRTWNYYTPGAKDIPVNLNVTIKKNSRNPVGLFGSKATGEPPLLMSIAGIAAIRKALQSAREDSGKQEDWFNIKMPLTCENTWLHGCTSMKDMTL